ncbi:galactosyltransferase, partial [Helicosporidium sp. ATCC 50920]
APGAQPKKRLLAVLAVYSGLRSRDRRDVLRKTWFPKGEALRAWEEERGVVVRFVIGGSDSQLDPVEGDIRAEAQEFGDILRLDVVDAYGVLSAKTLALFESLPRMHDADFYFKIDDDVAVNVPAFVGWLETRRSEQDLYVGCMKSGAVIGDPRSKWYEPEEWRFGDPSPGSQQAAYPRHASGQLYGLSRGVARYLGHAAPLLKKYANEDTSVGAWLLGLNVTLVHEPRLCCSGQKACAGQRDEASLCLAYFEASCAGICNPERRLEPIYRACLEDPLGEFKGNIPLWKNKRAAP